MLNSYEIESTVTTFITLVKDDGSASKNADIADRAKLDAISISSSEYAKSEWGDRVYDPAYKKVDLK